VHNNGVWAYIYFPIREADIRHVDRSHDNLPGLKYLSPIYRFLDMLVGSQGETP